MSIRDELRNYILGGLAGNQPQGEQPTTRVTIDPAQVALAHAAQTVNSGDTTYHDSMRQHKRTVQNELGNVPRIDIDGRRYGNTLSDDMFSIKNPARANQHTPESFNYLEPLPEEPERPAEPFITPEQQAYFNMVSMYNKGKDFRDYGLSREKYITDGGTGVYSDHYSTFDDPLTDQEQALWNYSVYMDEKQGRDDLANRDLSNSNLTADTRYIKTGGRSEHTAGEQNPRWGAEYDPDTDSYVNYEDRLSPATLRELTLMGRKPSEDSQLKGLIALYQYYLDNMANQ